MCESKVLGFTLLLESQLYQSSVYYSTPSVAPVWLKYLASLGGHFWPTDFSNRNSLTHSSIGLCSVRIYCYKIFNYFYKILSFVLFSSNSGTFPKFQNYMPPIHKDLDNLFSTVSKIEHKSSFYDVLNKKNRMNKWLNKSVKKILLEEFEKWQRITSPNWHFFCLGPKLNATLIMLAGIFWTNFDISNERIIPSCTWF